MVDHVLFAAEEVGSLARRPNDLDDGNNNLAYRAFLNVEERANRERMRVLAHNRQFYMGGVFAPPANQTAVHGHLGLFFGAEYDDTITDETVAVVSLLDPRTVELSGYRNPAYPGVDW